MDNLQRLIEKAADKQCRLQLRFDPDEAREQWSVKFYPHMDDDAHFYAYNNDLEAACHQLIDELRGFTGW